eukprot:781237-Prymnesium_polylepis.1
MPAAVGPAKPARPLCSTPRGDSQQTRAAETRKRWRVRKLLSCSNGAHLKRRHGARSTMRQQ